MTFKTIASSMLVGACGLVVAVAARADDSCHDQARAAADAGQARLTLQQAVTIAEVKLGGRVLDARLSDGEVYKLRLAGNDQDARRVRIAAYGGEILSGDKAIDRRVQP